MSKRKPGAVKGSPEWRARTGAGVRRANERRREAARVRPRDLQRLRRSGSVAPALRPLLDIAETEAVELMDSLGGPDRVTPQRRILVEDVTAVGMVLRGG
jgi:hypothetical protein